MNNYSFLFKAKPLSDSKVSDQHLSELRQFHKSLLIKIGSVIRNQLRLYRVPSAPENEQYQQYALIALDGTKSNCLIEISCNTNIHYTKWPSKTDIERGGRLSIEVVDWIDTFLLVNYLMLSGGETE